MILRTCQYKDLIWSVIILKTNIKVFNLFKLILFIIEYDAFIILHGTDTLSYTASALSFMIENLKKTVIITGAQVPMG